MIGCLMNQNDRENLAAERAEHYAPKPTGGSFMAGVCGAVIALLGEVALSRFYGWRLFANPWLTALSMGAGFLIVYVGYIRAKRLNRRAQRDELVQIEADEGR
jgi:hypothetical protein